MIYYIIFFILLITALFVDVLPVKGIKKYEKAIFIFLSVVLILFAGLRIDTGYDYSSYKLIYTQVSHTNFNEIFGLYNIEYGYIFINYLFRNLSYEIMIFIIALFSIGLKLLFIEKNLEKKCLAMFFYYSSFYLTYDMGVLRQGIALGILIWGYKYISERNLKKFIMIMVISSFFHVTSVIFIPLYFIYNHKFDRIVYYFIILLAFCSIFLHLSRYLLPFFIAYGGSLTGDKLEYYSTNYTQVNIVVNMIKRIVIFVFFYEYMRYKKVDNSNYLYLNAYVISIVMSCLFVDITVIANRGTVILYMSQIFIFSELIYYDTDLIKRLVTFALVILLSYISFTGPLNDTNQFYQPYKSLINERSI